MNRYYKSQVEGTIKHGLEVELDEENSKKIKISADNEESKIGMTFSLLDVQSTYKGATLFPKWKAFQTVIFLQLDDDLVGSSKVAAFDFDGCLVNTSVKRLGENAWSLMYPSIPTKLQNLHNDGYKLVIFTNESNIDRWKNKRQNAVNSKIGRLDKFSHRVGVPMQVFIACSDSKNGDLYRKPKPGMWHFMEKHFNSGISIDINQSFYVGDAAGRKGDFGDSDKKFAEAVGLKFFVPEDFFDSHPTATQRR